MAVKKIRQAVILAGGKGTRLMPLTKNTPKPMVIVNNKPFLEYLIELLKGNGIEEIVLLLGYLPDKVKNYFGDGSKLGVKIRYSIGEVSTNTGKRIKDASKLLDGTFMLMYCDNYWPISIKKMLESYNSGNKKYMMTVYSNPFSITRNNVLCNDDLAVKYDRERKDKGLNGVDIGFFVLNKGILKLMPGSNFSFEETIIPKLIKKSELAAYVTNVRYYSISTIEKLRLTEKFLEPKKIVFLDRDGVINKKPLKADYVKKWSEFEFLPDAIGCLKLLKENGFKTILVTNQPGIARGFMKGKDLAEIHKNMQKALKKYKAGFDAVYFCPHGWNDGCLCRKPKPGMLLKAANDLTFDLTKSFFIGDDERDAEAGIRAGCKTILITANYKNTKILPDFTCSSLSDAVKLLLKAKFD